MKWIKKKKKNPNSKEEEIEIQVEENEPNSKKPSSSSSNFSKILPFSSWLSKLKQFPKPNAAAAPITKRSTAPLPKRLFSPPPLPHPPADAIPRRLSVGDDETHLARTRAAQSLPRISRHNSIGSELELRSDLHLLDPIRTNRRRRQRAAAPNPMRGGQRPSAGRIRPKVRVFSPRLANPNPNPVGLERYAVVKRSKDPARDFRESMAEMIWERGIGRSDELESLLACYLSLNSDEHHDVIIKVFRQVWFDFNRELEIN